MLPTMRKILLVGVAAALLLTGCSATPEAIPAELYYENARAVTAFAESSDAALDGYAEEACEAMRAGDTDTSWLLGVKMLTEAGMDAEEAGSYLVWAASYRCPEMVERFPSS
jgi:hypothetical protein